MHLKSTVGLLVLSSSFIFGGCTDDPFREVSKKTQQTSNTINQNIQATYEDVQTQMDQTQAAIAKTKNDIETKAKELQQLAIDSKNTAEDKIEEVQQKIAETQKAYEDAKAALENLSNTAQELKGSLALPESS